MGIIDMADIEVSLTNSSSGSLINLLLDVGDDGKNTFETAMGDAGTYHQTILLQASEPGLAYGNFTFDAIPVSAVPVPAAVWLFGSGIVALLGFSRKNKSRFAA